MAHENNPLFTPLHGGDINAASERYGIATDAWVDLSTGINPNSYPHDSIKAEAFKSLPYLQTSFYDAAEKYYNEEVMLAVSGSQAVIQALPEVLVNKPLLAPAVGYQEYTKHWLKAGRDVVPYASFEHDEARNMITDALTKQNEQHLLIINPNNPTGLLFSADDIFKWANMLADGCCVIVDEAFADIEPSRSVLGKVRPENVIVLRSFGKFFGLAGVRLGYVFANRFILEQLNTRLGLWQINGPAQSLAISAFNDVVWQQQARLTIKKEAENCQQLFQPVMDLMGVSRQTHQGLFSSYQMSKASAYFVFETFAQQGILMRVIDVDSNTSLLRIGLLSKASSDKWNKVCNAVKAFCDTVNIKSNSKVLL